MTHLHAMSLAAILATAGAACQMQGHPENIRRVEKGRINLLHHGDPNLAGVIIYQDDPVNMNGDAPRNKGDHPFAIMYYFWDGSSVHDIAYDKEGKIVRDTWRPRFTPISKEEWARVDFSYGSDPAFKRHPDPR